MKGRCLRSLSWPKQADVRKIMLLRRDQEEGEPLGRWERTSSRRTEAASPACRLEKSAGKAMHGMFAHADSMAVLRSACDPRSCPKTTSRGWATRNLRYQVAAEMRADLQRLKRDTDSSRSAVPVAAEQVSAVTPAGGAQTQTPSSASAPSIPVTGAMAAATNHARR
jgi:hypothetical protein